MGNPQFGNCDFLTAQLPFLSLLKTKKSFMPDLFRLIKEHLKFYQYTAFMRQTWYILSDNLLVISRTQFTSQGETTRA